ncbi:hypothetical protein ACUIAJ_01530 [Dermabacteraceae bacterium CCM 9519]
MQTLLRSVAAGLLGGVVTFLVISALNYFFPTPGGTRMALIAASFVVIFEAGFVYYREKKLKAA